MTDHFKSSTLCFRSPRTTLLRTDSFPILPKFLSAHMKYTCGYRLPGCVHPLHLKKTHPQSYIVLTHSLPHLLCIIKMENGQLLGCVDWHPMACNLRQLKIIIIIIKTIKYNKYNSICLQTTKYQSQTWQNSKEVSYRFDIPTIIAVVFLIVSFNVINNQRPPFLHQ